MKKRNIIITTADHSRLMKLIGLIEHEAAKARGAREVGALDGLKSELERAQIVPPEEVPADVITMNSRAELLDLNTQETMEFTVVFPNDADVDEGRISVLAPIGTGMLGYRVGDVFEQQAPNGVRRLRVLSVQFQPESAVQATAA